MDMSPQFDKYQAQWNSLGGGMMGNRNGMLYNHPVLGRPSRKNEPANEYHAVENSTRYHGTNETFLPGDTLYSATSRGTKRKFGGGSVLNSGADGGDYTHSTASPDNAKSYATRAAKTHGGGPNVYEVAHQGPLYADPESPRSGTRSKGTMRVVRRVPDKELSTISSPPRYSRWE